MKNLEKESSSSSWKQFLRSDPRQEECFRRHGQSVEAFLRLLHLARFNRGQDIYALFRILASQGFLNRVQTGAFRVGKLAVPNRNIPKWRGRDIGLPSLDKPSLLSHFLDTNCNKLALVNRVLFTHFLSPTQQQIFMKEIQE